MLFFQASRIEDQRSSLPCDLPAPTVPDEDFLSLIMRVQSSRIDEQRSDLPGNDEADAGLPAAKKDLNT